MSEIGLRSYEFRREREPSWRDLEELVTRAEKKGVRSLSAEELARLPLLYRTVLSSLSVARYRVVRSSTSTLPDGNTTR